MDNKSLNFRIFRRNKKNLIIIWNLKNLTTDQKIEMHFELIPSDENDDTKSIEFVPFIPIDKTKFVDDVAGGVISERVHKRPLCGILALFGRTSFGRTS